MRCGKDAVEKGLLRKNEITYADYCSPSDAI
jgi:hypothetical protein